jgi:hypothetical protein
MMEQHAPPIHGDFPILIVTFHYREAEAASIPYPLPINRETTNEIPFLKGKFHICLYFCQVLAASFVI